MNKRINILAVGSIVMGLFAGCSSDSKGDDEKDLYKGYKEIGEITFERSNVVLAGPTSAGENLYSDYTGGSKFTEGIISFNQGKDAIKFGLNTTGYFPGTPTLYNGGMFLSMYNYRSNPDGKTGDWWYSYENQCSVYNEDSFDGSNLGAGADKSNTFAIVNGCCNRSEVSSVFGSGSEGKLGGFSFENGAEYLVGEIEICNTSYVYGTIILGNSFSSPLTSTHGWYKVLAYGYDASGRITNNGQPVEYTICNYTGQSNAKNIEDDWEDWDLSALGLVNRVVFNFEGSDSGEWGLNTPAYLAIDNIKIYAPK